jgi:hypothetical protein
VRVAVKPESGTPGTGSGILEAGHQLGELAAGDSGGEERENSQAILNRMRETR